MRRVSWSIYSKFEPNFFFSFPQHYLNIGGKTTTTFKFLFLYKVLDRTSESPLFIEFLNQLHYFIPKVQSINRAILDPV